MNENIKINYIIINQVTWLDNSEKFLVFKNKEAVNEFRYAISRVQLNVFHYFYDLNELNGLIIVYEEDNVVWNNGVFYFKKIISINKQITANFDFKELKINLEINFLLDEKLKPKKYKFSTNHQRLISNLLEINVHGDNAIFTKRSKNVLDLKQIISSSNYSKIINQKSFQKIEITKNNNLKSIKKYLKAATSYSQFNTLISENNINISREIHDKLLNNFNYNKTQYLNLIDQEDHNFLKFWKKFKNEYETIQEDKNTWPLYIGTCFVKSKYQNCKTYAPLLIKEVKIIIENGKVYLQSNNNNNLLNQKLLYYLAQNFSLMLPPKNDLLENTIKEISNNILYLLKDKLNFIDFFQEFVKNKKSDIVVDSKPVFAPGLVLMIMHPLGFRLRDELIEVLKNPDALDNLLNYDALKNNDKDINDQIKNKKKIYRITNTDLSQEKAIIGCLQDSGFIWGPPGTGKSQTIANLIANIIANNKSAIITSEKKAALDVIIERLGSLSKYIFFALKDKTANKDQFYRPFLALAEKITDEIPQSEVFDKNFYFNSVELNFLQNYSLLDREKIRHLVNTYNSYEFLQNYYPNVNSQATANLLDNWINNEVIWKYLSFIPTIGSKNIKKFPKKMNLKKKGFIFKKYDKSVYKFICEYKKLFPNNKKNNYLVDIFVKNVCGIFNFNSIFSFKSLLTNEVNYINNFPYFISDENIVEEIAFSNLKEKILELKISTIWNKKLNSFLRNCKSGWRQPLKFITLHKDIISYLFPVIISTPNQLSDILDFDQKYDYAIFDEASQIHLEKAIPYINIAKYSIISGDPKQMQPSNWFSNYSTLLDENDEVDEKAISLLTYAYNKGLGYDREYMLNKNYRSNYSELMIFSSFAFYDKKLIVIDNAEQQNTEPIEVINANGKWINNSNHQEGKMILERLVLELKNYSKIILLTLNRKQMDYIIDEIYVNESYNVLIDSISKSQLKIKNLENIQGDEADLVIVSIAYDKYSRLGSTYVGRKNGYFALNVAISRAKSKMIVYKSIYSDEILIKNNNISLTIFKKWVSYLEKSSLNRKNIISKKTNNINSKSNNAEYKEIVTDLSQLLENQTTITYELNYTIGSYLLDAVVKNKKTNNILFGIEILIYQDLKNTEKWKIIEKQRFLYLKKYNIFLISQLNWYKNKKQIKKTILKWCNQ